MKLVSGILVGGVLGSGFATNWKFDFKNQKAPA